MAGTRKARVPMAEQIRLITECRQSGMTDADWRRENDIAVSTFYNWVSRCRKVAAEQIPPPNYGYLEVPRLNRTWSPLTLFPITFRNSIQHHRCKTRTVTIHIRLKLLWRTSRSASAIRQILPCSPGHSVCFRSSHVRWYLRTWENLHCLWLHRLSEKNYYSRRFRLS